MSLTLSRALSSTAAVLKKRAPFKRLVTPIDGSQSSKLRAKDERRTEFYRKLNERSRSPREKKHSELPVLAEFDSAQLSQSASLVSKITQFDELKLEPAVRTAVVDAIREQTVLRAQNYENNPMEASEPIQVTPTPIQTLTIHTVAKHLMEPNMKIYTVAAETGSGKTWAYLAPLLDFLKQEELQPQWEAKQNKALVRAVILLPTHELVNQVFDSVKHLDESLGLHCVKWNYEVRHEEFIGQFRNRIDILVTTPGKIATLGNIKVISKPDHILQAAKFVVIDEADTLMDRSFVELTYSALKMMPNIQRMILCSATISNQYNNALQKIFPTSQPQLLVSPKMHRTPKNIKFKMIDSEIAPYQGSKNKALAQILYAIYKDGTELNYEKRSVVFVNNKQDVAKVAKKLSGYGHEVVALTGDDMPHIRAEKIKDFVNPPKLLSDLKPKEETKVEFQTIPGSNIQLKKKDTEQEEDYTRMRVLVTSDVASRGLNFFGVRNVILFDSPNTSVDLLHRIGRTGRMGQSGRVFLITDKKTRHWIKEFMKKRGASSTSSN